MWCRLRIKPQRLAAASVYGSAPMLNWLVEEKQITPHIPVIDKAKREEPNFKVPGSAQDDYTFGAQRDHDAHRPRRRSRAPFFRG